MKTMEDTGFQNKGVQHVHAVHNEHGASHCQIVYCICFLTVMSFILVQTLILHYSVSNCLIILKLRGVFQWAIRFLYIIFQDILKILKNI